jgi:ADP-heptose:LPS heptosyltransferase
MLEGFRRNVGLSYSRIHFRRNRDRIINFTDALTRSRRALIIFPESTPDNESTSTLFRYLLRKFSSEGMMVLLRDDQIPAMASTPPIKTLVYSSNDINAWFVPRRDLLKKMETNSFDVVLDLNVKLSLPSAFLCKASNAPLRVSFAKQGGDQFYNFQVQTKGTSGNSHSYRSLLKCLDMF